jgi:hypothetical protein
MHHCRDTGNPSFTARATSLETMGTYFEDWVLCDCHHRRAEKRSEIHVISGPVETQRQFASWQQPSRGLHSSLELESHKNIQLAEAKGDVADAEVCAVEYACLRRVVPFVYHR